MRIGPVIVLLFGTAIFAGWIAPDLGKSGEDTLVTAPTTAPDPPQSAARREAWLSGSTVLERAADGHFYADAEVSGHPAHFLVDTGASVVALTGQDARAIGLDWTESDVVRIGRGASGDVFGVPVRLDRIELGGFEAQGVDAAIIPEGLDVSLLGQTFLTQVRGVRIDGDRMILGEGE